MPAKGNPQFRASSIDTRGPTDKLCHQPQRPTNPIQLVMKNTKTNIRALILLTAISLALVGCETGGINARIQEKSTVFAALSPEQQQVIKEGSIELGYTGDMVYMALGKPSKVRAKDAPEGRVEMWTYNNYYPTVSVSQLSLNSPGRHGYRSGQTSPNAPRSSTSISSTASSGPEPSIDGLGDMPSDTLHVVLVNNQVIQLALESDSPLPEAWTTQ